MRPNKTGFVMLAMVLTLGAGACSGPQVKYDPSPAPGWIAQAAAAISPAELSATGVAPATTQSHRDLDLATRDAKARIARFFQSKVSASSLDWSLAMSGGAEASLVQQSTEVRSNVTVEDTRVEASYRDEASHSQYVLVRADRVAWARRLDGRIATGVQQFERNLSAAKAHDEAQRPLAALKALLDASRKGRALEPDVMVSDLLDHKAGTAKRLSELKAQLDERSRRLRKRYRFSIQVKAPDQKLAGRIQKNLIQFLAEWGFAAADQGEVHVQIQISQQSMGTEQVADRQEHLHGAAASLTVRDADGSAFPKLTIQVDPQRYQERDPDPAKAQQKALDLGADTLSAKFRSAFRNTFQDR